MTAVSITKELMNLMSSRMSMYDGLSEAINESRLSGGSDISKIVDNMLQGGDLTTKDEPHPASLTDDVIKETESNMTGGFEKDADSIIAEIFGVKYVNPPVHKVEDEVANNGAVDHLAAKQLNDQAAKLVDESETEPVDAPGNEDDLSDVDTEPEPVSDDSYEGETDEDSDEDDIQKQTFRFVNGMPYFISSA